jgi:hypothetical protein
MANVHSILSLTLDHGSWEPMKFCPREEITSRRLHEVAQYLESKRGSDGMIRREDIDPIIEIPRNASILMLVEETNDRRKRMRLVGSKVAEILGGDFTGKWIADLSAKHGPDWPATGIDRVFSTAEMLFGRAPLPWDSRPHIRVEWLGLRFARSSTMTRAEDANELAIFAFDQLTLEERRI